MRQWLCVVGSRGRGLGYADAHTLALSRFLSLNSHLTSTTNHHPVPHPYINRALGNLGNGLLAQGELKKALLEELRLSAAQPQGLGREGRLSLEGADARLRYV